MIVQDEIMNIAKKIEIGVGLDTDGVTVDLGGTSIPQTFSLMDLAEDLISEVHEEMGTGEGYGYLNAVEELRDTAYELRKAAERLEQTAQDIEEYS